MKLIVNNEIVDRNQFSVDIEDRGYQFGDGVYEVVRIYNGRFFTLHEHLERLENSAKKIKLDLPVTMSQFVANAHKLIELENIENGIIYIQVTRGTAPRVHYFPKDIRATLVAYATKVERPEKNLTEGVSTILTEDIRWLRCDIKSINLLGNVLAKEEAKEAGAFEAILHRGNIVTEGSSTNIWMIKDGVVYTHPATNLILNGITRQVILSIAKELNIQVKEQQYTIDDIRNADEVFLSSTTSEVMPIISIDGKKVGDGKPGNITKQLQNAFKQKIELVTIS